MADLSPSGFYDVGAIAREIQAEFKIFARAGTTIPMASIDQPRNLATPINLARLLSSLDALTESIRERRRVVQINDAGDVHFDHDLLVWRGRFEAYKDAVNAAIADGRGEDRSAVLWTVTAPLLLGFFGGQGSKLPQQRLDAVTPFVLANMLTTSEDWRAERGRQFWSDLKQGAADVIDAARAGLGVLPIALGFSLGLGLVIVLSRR